MYRLSMLVNVFILNLFFQLVLGKKIHSGIEHGHDLGTSKIIELEIRKS